MILPIVVVALLGAAAGAIDAVRSEKVSKDLRDNYTALSLGNISYVMLISTALACAQSCVAHQTPCESGRKSTSNQRTPRA